MITANVSSSLLIEEKVSTGSEEDYVLDRFNLTGLNTEMQHYVQVLDMVTDNLGMLLHLFLSFARSHSTR